MTVEFRKLIDKAQQAGIDAVSKLDVTPMIVSDKYGNKQYYVADGVCGFAWVTLRPANSKFARYLKTQGWRSAYGGGIQLWVSAFNQSMQKKEAYAYAFAEVLQDAGYKASAGSRMD